MDAEQKQRAHTILRDLKGARISILLALFIEAMPTNQKKLAQLVPYSVRTVRDELEFLELGGYVERVHHRLWKLPGNNQLPLPGFEHLVSGRAGSLPPGGDAEAAKSAASALSTTTTVPSIEAAKFAGSEIQTTVVGSIVEDETAKSAVSWIPAEIRAALVEIRINGQAIGTEKWPELANARRQVTGEPVTAHYLQAMAARVRQHPKEQYRNTGFFIHCVRQGDEEPKWCEECNSLGGAHAPRCATGRYEKYG